MGVVNMLILILSTSLIFKILQTLDVIPLISAVLNLNFHLLMLSMLLLEEFPSTLHQIQLHLKLHPHPEPELLLQLHPKHLLLPQHELLPVQPSVVFSVLAQFSPATWFTTSMMMISCS